MVLTRTEVRQLLEAMDNNIHKLMASLLSGCGLRLLECIRLLVQDIEFKYQKITMRNAKGDKDRLAPLPGRLVQLLPDQLVAARKLRKEDLSQGKGEVFLPYAYQRKASNAAKEWIWQYVFPSIR